MIRLTTLERGTDSHGSGAYGASRGSRKHKGIDYAAQPGSYVHSLVHGFVTKLGTVYPDTPNYKYVEVEDEAGYKVACFYVKPSVKVGDVVCTSSVIGTVQDLDSRYKGITPHIHLRVKDPQGNKINPKEHFKQWN